MKKKPVIHSLVFILSSLYIAIASLTLSVGNGQLNIFYDYFRYPLCFILNWFPVIIIAMLALALTGRQWASFFVTSFVIGVASVGNYYKMKFRSEVFVFSDLSAISTAFGVAGDYDLSVNSRILLTIVGLFLGSFLIFLFFKQKYTMKTRFIIFILALMSAAAAWGTVYSSDTIYHSDLIPQRTYGHLLYENASKGFIYNFVHSIKSEKMSKPDGYKTDKAISMLSEYENRKQEKAKNIDIIAIQLEAFADLRKLGISNISDSAYSIYDSIKKEGYSGNLVVNVRGGGTLNTEHCVLTGDYSFYDVKKDAFSFVRYLANEGYTCVGGHPYFSYYNREHINKWLGFDDFRTADNFEGYNIIEYGNHFSDYYFINSILDQYKALKENGEAVFSFNVTMQGHAPYNTDSYIFSSDYYDEGISEYSQYVINNYLGSIHDTQEYLSAFLKEIRETEYPIVVVLYGDHQPWMGDNYSVLDELGVNTDVSTEQGFLNSYSTEYVFWANPAAQREIGDSCVGTGPTISPGYLFPLLFERLGWSGNEYSRYLTARMGEIQCITTNGYYIENGVFTRELSEAGETEMRKAELLQHYMRTDFELKE